MSKIIITKYIYECKCGHTWHSTVKVTTWGEVCKECGEFASWQGKMLDEMKERKSVEWTIDKLPNLVEAIFSHKDEYLLELLLLVVSGIIFLGTYYVPSKIIAIFIQIGIIIFIWSLLVILKNKIQDYID